MVQIVEFSRNCVERIGVSTESALRWFDGILLLPTSHPLIQSESNTWQSEPLVFILSSMGVWVASVSLLNMAWRTEVGHTHTFRCQFTLDQWQPIPIRQNTSFQRWQCHRYRKRGTDAMRIMHRLEADHVCRCRCANLGEHYPVAKIRLFQEICSTVRYALDDWKFTSCLFESLDNKQIHIWIVQKRNSVMKCAPTHRQCQGLLTVATNILKTINDK